MYYHYLVLIFRSISTVPSLLKRWKRLQSAMDLSAEAFEALNDRLENHAKRWLQEDQDAQSDRKTNSSAMDIYDTVTKKRMHITIIEHIECSYMSAAPSAVDIQRKLMSKESRRSATHGQTSWIALGIGIQEMQYVDALAAVHICIYAHMVCRLALKYQLRCHKSKLTPEETQVIENKQGRLQTLIDKFEHQADSFILHYQGTEIPHISPISDYNQYDNYGNMNDPPVVGVVRGGHSKTKVNARSSDNSWMDLPDPAGVPILLPSTLGWNWCADHGLEDLAAKEAELRLAQADESIHKIRLALGFKSAIFRTQVRSAKSQQTKSRAWNNVKRVDVTVHEYARIYSMARDAYMVIRAALPTGTDLPLLNPEDLHIATLVLGSEQKGQWNKHRSWLWGFGKAADDDGTWMEDCKRLYMCIILLFSHGYQLNECTGFVPRRSLNDGWKNRIAFIMKLNGFLLTSTPNQRCGRSLWYLLQMRHSKDIRHTHHIRCRHGRNFL